MTHKTGLTIAEKLLSWN